ncbi:MULTISPECIES: hypothetical protein [unclassified Cryobacterium]|uniref:hypothetical protein n=1 Tax=unclassified Cryobacterium TaxID=2649013 RepID=UPI00106B24CB|nr:MULTISPECIES: hypothetical protein [unclassified Cryobacterium]TFC59435.1 hypothetical protein E3O68_00615 [Cryobacterium sp. TMB3-1-2]TFC67231.1 hypothetical protein E3T21_17310 [Cryobacterium sp. TMB3-15]TFC73256.1 hypothetical protein E3T22_16745 [Cryobacterium sp. TMB3-10]TFD46144.1 hypothetical protein E3T58_01380 [Cryobacterium sp. TMB3-12]
MTRMMPSDSTESFRVILHRKTGTRELEPLVYGAFPTLAGAKSVRTREIRGWSRVDYYDMPDRTATGRIQRTATAWQDVEEANG